MDKKMILIVLDGCGAGALPDAAKYGDEGTNTLLHVLEKTSIDLPNLNKLGLSNIFNPTSKCTGAYGMMAEKSVGKDTTVGHWEMMGCISRKNFELYPDGFPKEIIDEFTKRTGYGVLGNKAASGTQIIEELGEEHVKTGKPIIYTSADSVFQIAAHVDVISTEELYRICQVTRNMLGQRMVRVIARPFKGNNSEDFQRISVLRKDFGLGAPQELVIDTLSKSGIEVHAVGKVSQIFTGRGIDKEYKNGSNSEGIEQTVSLIKELSSGFIFTNLVDFDMLWGHRNDYYGFAKGLKELDDSIPKMIEAMNDEDILIITADHGCDPTMPGTDHTREYVPLLVYGKQLKENVDLGIRQTFADIGQTIAEYNKIEPALNGRSFLDKLCKK